MFGGKTFLFHARRGRSFENNFMPNNKNGNGRAENANHDDLARGLGWFSLGIGLLGLFAPRRVNRLIGAGNHSALLRLIALRELVSGGGLLTQRDPSTWLKARVAGDRSEEHTSELQSRLHLVCRLLL